MHIYPRNRFAACWTSFSFQIFCETWDTHMQPATKLAIVQCWIGPYCPIACSGGIQIDKAHISINCHHRWIILLWSSRTVRTAENMEKAHVTVYVNGQCKKLPPIYRQRSFHCSGGYCIDQRWALYQKLMNYEKSFARTRNLNDTNQIIEYYRRGTYQVRIGLQIQE